jgi:magnesium transporter
MKTNCDYAIQLSGGFDLPWIFNRFERDPAFGSGPLATVIQDLLSIWIYLFVATIMM